MRRLNHWRSWLCAVGVCVPAVVCGCSRHSQGPSAVHVPLAGPTSAALGDTVAAGPYTVSLTTRSKHILKGRVTFIATVARDGEPVHDARVTLNLSRPAVAATGPSIPLKWDAEHYVGQTDVLASGNWHADVVVDAPGDSGTAMFAFTLNP